MKYSMPTYGMLIEVTKSDYDEFYKGFRRQLYLDARSLCHGDILYNSFDGDEFNGDGYLVDDMTDI